MSLPSMNPGRHVLELDGVPGLFALDGLETGSDPKLSASALGTASATAGVIIMRWGAGMPAGCTDWLRSALNGTARPRGARVLTMSTTNAVEIQRVLADAVITRIEFPRLDVASKEAASIRVTISARSIQLAGGQGDSVTSPVGTAQKKWLPSNFKFEMGSLPTASVDVIESIVISPPAPPRELRFRVAAQYAAPFREAARSGRGHTTEILFVSNTYPAPLGRLEFPVARVVAVEEGRVPAVMMDSITKASVRVSPGMMMLHWSR